MITLGLSKLFADDVEVPIQPTKRTFTGEDDLKKVLQSYRLKLSRETPPPRKGVSFAPHAISFPFCRRAKIGQLAGLIDLYYDNLTPRVQTGMDIGSALHDMVQTYFWNVGLLKGSFECLKCDKTYDDIISPTSCPSGKVTHKRKHLRFREVTLRNDTYKIYGRSDGLLNLRDGVEPLEIKSLYVKPQKNSNEFQFYFDDLETKGPKEAHVLQLMLYMFMLEATVGNLLYICKNDGRIKTYKIEYDESLIALFLEQCLYLQEQAQKLKAGEHIDLPPCCSSETCPCHKVISPRSQ